MHKNTNPVRNKNDTNKTTFFGINTYSSYY